MDLSPEWLQAFKEFLVRHINVSDHEFAAVQKILEPVHLSKGELFVGHVRDSIRCGFIIKGLLRTYFITEKGEEFTTDFCRENEVTTNYDSLMSGMKQEFYSEALEDSIILSMDNSRFDQLAQSYPAFKTLKSTLIEYYYSEKINREKELLSLKAEQRYLRFVDTHKRILHRIPQYHIASYLGITPVALSRIRKGLKIKVC